MKPLLLLHHLRNHWIKDKWWLINHFITIHYFSWIHKIHSFAYERIYQSYAISSFNSVLCFLLLIFLTFLRPFVLLCGEISLSLSSSSFFIASIPSDSERSKCSKCWTVSYIFCLFFFFIFPLVNLYFYFIWFVRNNHIWKRFFCHFLMKFQKWSILKWNSCFVSLLLKIRCRLILLLLRYCEPKSLFLNLWIQKRFLLMRILHLLKMKMAADYSDLILAILTGEKYSMFAFNGSLDSILVPPK